MWKSNCSYIYLKIWRFRITVVVKYWSLSSSDSFGKYFIKQVKPFEFHDSAILSLIWIVDFHFVTFVASVFNKFDLFTHAVQLSWIALLHNYLYNKLSLEIWTTKYWNILNFDLHIQSYTSCLLFRSTLGNIFSISCFRVSLKLSLSFLSRNSPSTLLLLGLTPIRIVPPLVLRKETIAFNMLHFTVYSLNGIEYPLNSIVWVGRSSSWSSKDVRQPIQCRF